MGPSKTTRSFIPSIAHIMIVTLIALLVAPVVSHKIAFAASAPTSPARAFYVFSNWSDMGTRGRSVAYDFGFTSDPGVGTGNFLVIDFGRQKSDPGQGWGISPVGTTTFHPNSWAKIVAQDFIDGYAANTGHTQVGKVVVAVNNDNEVTSNNNNVDWNQLYVWQNAAGSWGTMVNYLTVKLNTQVWSGNDIEAWNTCPNCTGTNTVGWVQALNTNFPSLRNLNFGSNTFAENNVTWTQDQLYQVSYGIGTAYVAPEIYCSKQPGQWEATQNAKSNAIYFSGVTSINGNPMGGPCVVDSFLSYTWQAAWTALYDALTDKTKLDSGVTIFN